MPVIDPAAKAKVFTVSGHERTRAFACGLLAMTSHELPANIWANLLPPLCPSH